MPILPRYRSRADHYREDQRSFAVALGDELVCMYRGICLGGNLGLRDRLIRRKPLFQCTPDAHARHDSLVGRFLRRGSQSAVQNSETGELEGSFPFVHMGRDNPCRLYTTLLGLLFFAYVGPTTRLISDPNVSSTRTDWHRRFCASIGFSSSQSGASRRDQNRAVAVPLKLSLI